MKTNQTRSLLAGLPPHELLASFGLPPDVLDPMMDDDQMALRVLVLTRGAVIERKPANYWVDAGRTGKDQKARVLHEPQFFTRCASGSSVPHLGTPNWGISQ